MITERVQQKFGRQGKAAARRRTAFAAATGLVMAAGLSQSAQALRVDSVDFDSLVLGAKIVGPVGPDVNSSVIAEIEGELRSVGDFQSSVYCPAGVSPCVPGSNAPGTIYTYAHTVTPGTDQPNSGNLPQPDPVTGNEFSEFAIFQTGFTPNGFTGVAGYSFSDAQAAGVEFFLDTLDDDGGKLSWSITDAGWDKDETITFFWQTTAAPVGPDGVYEVTDDIDFATAAGPRPGPAPIPLPAPLILFMSALGALGFCLRRKKA